MCLFVKNWEISLVSDLFPFKMLITTREYREAVKLNTEVSIDKITACETSSSKKYQSIFSQFSESPVHFHCQSLKHFIWTWTTNSRRSIDQFTRPFHIGEKKMIRKKNRERFLTAPVVRLSSEAVSRRPHEGSGKQVTQEEKTYVNCQVWKSIPQLQLLLKWQHFREKHRASGLAGFSEDSREQ